MSRLTWLHLSDLHYGNPKDAWDAKGVQRDLIKDLKKLSREQDLTPDLIFFTGDLAFGHLGPEPGKSLKSQYEGVEKFLDEVRFCFGPEIPKERIFLVPGNHDVNRSRVGKMAANYLDSLSDQDGISDFFAAGKDDLRRVMERLEDYRSFLETAGFTHLLQDPEHLTYGLTKQVRDLRVGIGGFNTVWSSGRNSAEENGKLRIAWKWQAATILEHLQDTQVNIALFHHPLSWGAEPETTFADPFLRKRFHFILTGHEHRTGVTSYADGHAKISSYACYHRKQGSGYNICSLDFEKRDGRVFLRKYSTEDGGGWVSQTTLDASDGQYRLELLSKWMKSREPVPPYDPEGEISEAKAPGPQADDPAFEAQVAVYCRKAATLYDKLPMVGFGISLRFSIRIEEIYMPLHAMVDEAEQSKACYADADDAKACAERLGRCREISIPQAFQACRDQGRRGILILGDPGSGKTTHLKRLLLWALSKDWETIGLPQAIIPLFLPLRELKDKDILGFICERLADAGLEMPETFTRNLLASRPVLLLLDGLDEIRDPGLRASASRQISRFLKGRDNLYAAVTCRFAGYTPSSRLEDDFMELHLRPLTRDQARTFIRTWYRIVEKAVNSDPVQAAAVAGQKAGELSRILESQEFRVRRVFEMTRNPLLLTNLCLVHRDRGRLPKTRGHLYRAAMDILLEFWQGGQGLETRIGADKGRRILQPVAYWMHQEEGRTRAPARELEKILDPELRKMKWARGTARDFLQMVRDDSGLLTGWGGETFGFMHLGFQEYLAACHIRNRSFEDETILGELAGHFGESWWQEVILLLLGLEEPSRFGVFMENVIKRPVFARHPEMSELCLDDAAEVDWVPFTELLAEKPGKNREKWERQLAALNLLKRHVPERLMPLAEGLAGHPMADIRTAFQEKAEADGSGFMLYGGILYEMVKILAGSFMMGSPEDEKERFEDEGPCHEVTLDPFYMGRYPVTNKQYGAYLKANPEAAEPEFWGDREFNGPSQPVVGISWEEARAFALWAGLELPSEAQWEYACRAGTATRFYTGDGEEDLARAGWYGNNSENRLHPVGEKAPNAYGLFDMHGNVWEWMADHWHDNYEDAPDDGSAWEDSNAKEGSYRVIRGGSFFDGARRCRSACRFGLRPSDRYQSIGFRLVLPPGRQAEQEEG